MSDKTVTLSPLSNWSTGYPAVCRCSIRYSHTRTHTQYMCCFKCFILTFPCATPSHSQTWQPADKASCHVVRSPAPLPILDLDFKEKMVLEGIIWQELNVLFGTVIFQSAGLEGRGWGGLAQRCYVASGSEPWLWM